MKNILQCATSTLFRTPLTNSFVAPQRDGVQAASLLRFLDHIQTLTHTHTHNTHIHTHTQNPHTHYKTHTYTHTHTQHIHTHTHTLGRTLLDETSTGRKDLYLTKKNTPSRQTDIRVSDRIRTRSDIKQAAANPRLRPRGLRVRPFLNIRSFKSITIYEQITICFVFWTVHFQ